MLASYLVYNQLLLLSILMWRSENKFSFKSSPNMLQLFGHWSHYKWVTFSPKPWWSRAVWPDWAISWTLGNFLRPLEKINLPKSFTFLRNICKGVNIYHFSNEIILGNFYSHLAIFFWSYCYQGGEVKSWNVLPIVSLPLACIRYWGLDCPNKKSFQSHYLSTWICLDGAALHVLN